jgi:phosphopantothenoylcysteine decarboxylase/phosphopantothenate--cysteine ligase
MYEEVLKILKEEHYDYIILAAAMNDFELENIVDEKISSSESFEIKLKPTKKLADKIKEVSPESKLALFKAEYKRSEEELITIAQERMKGAKADLIVANDVSATEFGFESDKNKVVILNNSGDKIWVEDTKLNVAKKIIDQLEKL